MMQMPLHVRAEVKLRLLDQQHELAQVRREQMLHAPHEREAAVGRRPVMLCTRRTEQLGDIGRTRSRRGRHHRARA
jgi:hypothetical protein